MNVFRKVERWFKRLVTKARTLFEQLEDAYEALPPPLRSVFLTALANAGYLPHFSTEAELWRYARKWKDDMLEQAIAKAKAIGG